MKSLLLVLALASAATSLSACVVYSAGPPRVVVGEWVPGHWADTAHGERWIPGHYR